MFPSNEQTPLLTSTQQAQNQGSIDRERGLDGSNGETLAPPSSSSQGPEKSDSKMMQSQDDHEHKKNGLVNAIFGKIDPRIMSDLIIGLSDGLTVPFALTAGLSSLGDSKLVLLGGFAELISGTISMGLGGYLGAKSEADYYKNEVNLEKAKFFNQKNRDIVLHDVEDILMEINPNFKEQTIFNFIKDLQKEPEMMLSFIIRFGKGLEEPGENRALTSATTIGLGYFLGGFIPLLPYFFVDKVGTGLLYSILVMIFTLFWFGYIKAQLSMDDCSTKKKLIEGLEMVAVGGVAAGAAWFFVRTIEN